MKIPCHLYSGKHAQTLKYIHTHTSHTQTHIHTQISSLRRLKLDYREADSDLNLLAGLQQLQSLALGWEVSMNATGLDVVLQVGGCVIGY